MRWALFLIAIAFACSCDKPADKPAAAAAAVTAAPAPARMDPAPPGPAKREDRHEPAVAAARASLAITIAGGVATTWADDVLARAPKLGGTASDGEARDTWSLRELVRRNVGPSARVTAVLGADGKQPIEAGAWSDAARTPILHTTRRGTLKFRWADKDGRWGETVVRDVTGLEISDACGSGPGRC